MRLLIFLVLLVGIGLLGYRLGRRRPSLVSAYPPLRPPEIVVHEDNPSDDRREVAQAAQELSRWLESAGGARDEVSPATWERIADASSRIAAAAGRLSARQGSQ